MTFLGEDLTPEGDALAVYGCGHRHCGYREGWTLNPHNNQPCKALSGHAG